MLQQEGRRREGGRGRACTYLIASGRLERGAGPASQQGGQGPGGQQVTRCEMANGTHLLPDGVMRCLGHGDTCRGLASGRAQETGALCGGVGPATQTGGRSAAGAAAGRWRRVRGGGGTVICCRLRSRRAAPSTHAQRRRASQAGGPTTSMAGAQSHQATRPRQHDAARACRPQSRRTSERSAVQTASRTRSGPAPTRALEGRSRTAPGPLWGGNLLGRAAAGRWLPCPPGLPGVCWRGPAWRRATTSNDAGAASVRLVEAVGASDATQTPPAARLRRCGRAISIGPRRPWMPWIPGTAPDAGRAAAATCAAGGQRRRGAAARECCAGDG